MKAPSPTVLILDDDADSRAMLELFAKKRGFEVLSASTLAEGREHMEAGPDLALLDVELPDGNGLDLARELADSETQVVMVSGRGNFDVAIDALRSHVADFLPKPVDTQRLKSVLNQALERFRLRGEIHALRDELKRFGRFGRLVGQGERMQELYEVLAKVAPTNASVLITGETGSGKERVAESIHELSRRAHAPFVVVNCGAIPADLIGSELFGHEKGAFTGANKTRKGCFEQADGGTLFLDEVTEMPMEQQVNLLRVLENGTFRRLGSESDVKVDVRVLAATNRDPKFHVEKGQFREDLMYRLAVFPVTMPPLRERSEDIELLARVLLQDLTEEGESPKRLSNRALRALETHAWPGNVRELKNVLQRSAIMASNETIDVDDLALDVEAPLVAGEGMVQIEVGRSIAEAEKALILATMEALDGDKKRVAETLGISLKTLYTRLNRYEG